MTKLTWEMDTDGNLVPMMEGHSVVYSPLPGSQEKFLTCPIFEVLYHGGRGNGKSLTLLMSFVQHIGKGFKAAWKGIIFRRTFPELQDIIAASQEWFPKIFPDAEYNIANHTWTFRDGEKLIFGHIDKPSDYWKYHGQQFPFIAFEELTTWSTSECYLSMFSCCRTATKGVPLMIRSTTNPNGLGNSWIKDRFNLAGENKTVGDLLSDPETPSLKRVSIKGTLQENKVLLNAQPTYTETIVMAAAGNQDTIKAWIEGSWDINSSGFFSDSWDYSVHTVPSFPAEEIPPGWRITRSYDYGSSAPFSVLWIATSNGDPILWDEKEIGGIRGDIIIFNEWYGADKKGKGLRMLSSDVAKGILNREKTMSIQGRVAPGVADSAIWTNTEGTSIAQQFTNNGINWIKCSKGKGSRVAGWQQVLELLESAKANKDGIRETPGLFISDRCPELKSHLTNAPRDTVNPDDIDTTCPDHDLDALRYAIYKPKVSRIIRNPNTQLY